MIFSINGIVSGFVLLGSWDVEKKWDDGTRCGQSFTIARWLTLVIIRGSVLLCAALLQVAITIFWLARQVQGVYVGPELDLTNFTALVNAKTLSSSLAAGSSGGFAHQHQYSSSGDWTEPESRHSHQHSRTRWVSMLQCVLIYSEIELINCES